MNQFAKTLSALIASKHGSIREFARVCGVTFTNVSRIISGERRCSPEMLRVLCEHISSEPLERYDLLFSHMMDEAEGSGLDVTRILLRHIDGVNLSELELSPEMNGQLGIIARAAARIPEVAESVESLSGLIARIEAHEADDAARASGALRSRSGAKSSEEQVREIDRTVAHREKKVQPARRRGAKSSL